MRQLVRPPAAAAVEEETAIPLLLRPFSIAAAADCGALKCEKYARRNRKIAALFYCGIKTYILYSKFLQISD